MAPFRSKPMRPKEVRIEHRTPFPCLQKKHFPQILPVSLVTFSPFRKEPDFQLVIFVTKPERLVPAPERRHRHSFIAASRPPDEV
jgi:hypothetical protein